VIVDGADDLFLEDLYRRVIRDAVHHDAEGVLMAVLGLEEAAEGSDAVDEAALADDPPRRSRRSLLRKRSSSVPSTPAIDRLFM